MKRFLVLFGAIPAVVAGCGGEATNTDPTYVPPTSIAGFLKERVTMSSYLDPIESFLPTDTSGAWAAEVQTQTPEGVATVSVTVLEPGTGGAHQANDVICTLVSSATLTDIPGFTPLERQKYHLVGTGDTCNMGWVGMVSDWIMATIQQDASGSPSMVAWWMMASTPDEAIPALSAWEGGGVNPFMICPKDAQLGDEGCTPFCHWPLSGDSYVTGGGACPTLAELRQ
jgi:hypothetical protein